MKMKKRTAALLLAVLLAVAGLAGCKDTGGGSQTGFGTEDAAGAGGSTGAGASTADGYGGKGRFLESEISFPEQVNKIMTAARLADGSVSAVGFNSSNMQYYIMNTKDMGQSWDSRKISMENVSYLAQAAIAPDGSAVLLENYGAIRLVAADGTASEGALALPEYREDMDTENQILQAMYTESGKLVILDMNGDLYQADISSGTLKRVSENISQKADYFGMAGNRILAVTGSGVAILESESGELVKDELLAQVTDSTREPSGGEDSYPVVFTVGPEEESVVYVNHEGLYYHQASGSVNEQLINGGLVSLGDTSFALKCVMFMDETSYLVLGCDSLGNSRLYHYIYDAEASAVPEKQLKIYALEDSQVLQQAISYFQKQHQDVFVKKIIGLSGGDGITAEDALRALSTDIMAGNGPDVLILDGIPVESYIEKGILADISGLVDEVDKSDGIFSNIKAVYTTDGSIYEMPSRFFFSGIQGEKEALAASGSLKQLVDYAKEAKSRKPDDNILPPMTKAGLLNELYYADSANWRAADGTMDEAKLREYLTAAGELFALDSYGEELYNTSVSDYSLQNGILYGSIPRHGISRLIDHTALSIGTITGIDDVQSIFGVEEQMGGDYTVFGAEGSFVPYVSVGITAGAAENPLAQEFVTTILGKECGSASDSGFSVNRAAYEERQLTQIEYSEAVGSEDGTIVGVEISKLTEQQLFVLTEHLESLHRSAWTDRVIHELVISEGEKYLNGRQSVEDTVAAIMQKVKLYTSE